MVQKDWRELFWERILERGKDYYRDGAVTKLESDGKEYRAVVEGTEDYTVSIKTEEDGQIAGMTCTCPFAEDGKHCKHMAAVLYQIEAIEEDPEEPPERARLRSCIRQFSMQELQDLLLFGAEGDEVLRNIILQCEGSTMEAKETEGRILRDLKRVPLEFTDSSGRIPLQKGTDYAIKLTRFLETFAEELLEKNWTLSAFHVTNAVLEQLMSQHLRSGDVLQVAISCAAFWKIEVEQATPEEREIIHNWFRRPDLEDETGLITDLTGAIIQDCFLQKPVMDRCNTCTVTVVKK